eukprot:7193718-Ditylum_brightwellii.AAC.1
MVDGGNTLAILLIKACCVGSRSYFVNTTAVINSPEVVTLSSVLHQYLAPKFAYDKANIAMLTTSKRTDTIHLLALPISYTISIIKNQQAHE